MKRQSEGHIVWVFLRNKENASTEACSAASAPKEVGHFKDTHTHVHTHAHTEWGEDVFSRTQMSEDKLRQC